MKSRYRYRNQINSTISKIKILSSLRSVAALPVHLDISERQWSVLESNLSAAQNRLLNRLKNESKEYLKNIHEPESARGLNSLLGEIELELSKSLTFFDTFMDMLTQRSVPQLGRFLAGCDVIAWDAIRKDHPALDIIEPPLVFCDRGFGASILREGVPLPDGTPNPMPTIQIPYSKLKETYNLTSIIHEAGHEAMVRLGLVSSIPKALKLALELAGAPDTIRDLYATWSLEIGPDFWTFCNSGIAQSASIKEILSLPPNHVFKVSTGDPHPPPYSRVLVSFEWCRQLWGHGQWDDWEREWLLFYPLDNIENEHQKLLKSVRKYIPVVCKTLFNTKFRALGGKTIPSLFNLDSLAPWRIERIVRSAKNGVLDLSGLTPCVQLCVFRMLRDNSIFNENTIEKMMLLWLEMLGKRRMFI